MLTTYPTQAANGVARSSIMQLLERYRQDQRPHKLNLTVGIYTDEFGVCPILGSVRHAEHYRIEHQTSKASFNLLGAAAYHRAVRAILFPTQPADQPCPNTQVIQTLGASGAIHLAGQLLGRHAPGARIWLSAPTWENHSALMSGLRGGYATYRHLAGSPQRLCLDTVLADLESAAPGDIVLLHVCCHNPTGIDPDPAQWAALANFCAERKLIPLFDFAYQGFACSIQEDAIPLSLFMARLDTLLICYSFSKNMGIYDERTGALTLICQDADQLARWTADIKILVRSSYSMPPLHGSFIASHIINDPRLLACWQQEVAEMRDDLKRRHAALLNCLDQACILEEVLSYRCQQGMFLCLDLTIVDIEHLRNQHGIYMLDSGRISVASLSLANMPRFCDALAHTIRQGKRQRA